MLAASTEREVAGVPSRPRRGRSLPPVLRALLAQLGAVLLAFVFLHTSSASGGANVISPLLVQAVAAAAMGQLLRLPAWWIPINALFLPLVLWTQTLQVHPVWYLIAFGVLLSLFWSTYRTRVPLYLTGAHTCARLAALLPDNRPLRVLDLGCGFGGVLLALHRMRPSLNLAGREIAPVPAWIARLRVRDVPGVHVRRADFWKADLSSYDLVYAFLSPEPMSELWHKVRAEMRPGSLFVSNTFAVKDATPDLVLPGAGDHGFPLYVWRL